jgi:hypothetical protein
VTLQNLNGTGKGCPVASTTFQAQETAINNAGAQAALSARQSALSPPLTPAQIEALAPRLGFTAGQNPSGESPNASVYSPNNGNACAFLLQEPATAMAQ